MLKQLVSTAKVAALGAVALVVAQQAKELTDKAIDAGKKKLGGQPTR